MQPGSEELEEKPSTITIFDPVAGYQYSLVPRGLSASRSEIGPVPIIQAPPPGANGNASTRPTNAPADPARLEITDEQLGSQTIEGLNVTGTKQTMTYPPHSFGNDVPVVTTVEQWRSLELKFDVLNIRLDPRSGETKIRVTDINRAEPDPSLFQVPADYTIRGR